ncbi:hypothetical protein XENORESO_013192 [Xenotaenia resolanae]|uniref:Uncharacterized protein n=1 Tax=Xenotaenia resolanae TaxID=208358 RepID=A0ABV0WYZ1_9TELE
MPPNPTKQHIREHCRTKIPQPRELLERVESVLQKFFLESDPDGVPLFKPSILKMWRIQRAHILPGCLSDPEVGEGVLYRHGGMVHPCEREQGSCTAVDPCVRHFPAGGFSSPPIKVGHRKSGLHRTFPGTGNDWSCSLERLVDLKLPDVKLPLVFDPTLL